MKHLSHYALTKSLWVQDQELSVYFIRGDRDLTYILIFMYVYQAAE